MSRPRCCLNQYTKLPKRQYTDHEEAQLEAERLNGEMGTSQYDVYRCTHCSYIHVGRRPLRLSFAKAVRRRDYAPLAEELGPRALHCLWQENETPGEEARIRLMVRSWRRATPPREGYPPRVLPK